MGAKALTYIAAGLAFAVLFLAGDMASEAKRESLAMLREVRAQAVEARVVAACMPKAEGEIAYIAKTASGFDCSLTSGGPAQLRAVKHRKEFSL